MAFLFWEGISSLDTIERVHSAFMKKLSGCHFQSAGCIKWLDLRRHHVHVNILKRVTRITIDLIQLSNSLLPYICLLAVMNYIFPSTGSPWIKDVTFLFNLVGLSIYSANSLASTNEIIDHSKSDLHK